MRAVITAAFALGCSSAPPAATPDPDRHGAETTADPARRPPATPPALDALAGATDALCRCTDAGCADPAYERLAVAVGERDLGAWSPAHRQRFHQLRWQGEECNLVLLVGVNEPEVLEHAREALRDRYAAAAPTLIEAVYQQARALHGGGGALPSTGVDTPEAGACCRWSDGLCRPDPALWQRRPWSALDFAVDEPQAYSLSYRRTGATEVTVRATGDIDCDGRFGIIEVTGDVASRPSGLIRLTDHLE